MEFSHPAENSWPTSTPSVPFVCVLPDIVCLLHWQSANCDTSSGGERSTPTRYIQSLTWTSASPFFRLTSKPCSDKTQPEMIDSAQAEVDLSQGTVISGGPPDRKLSRKKALSQKGNLSGSRGSPVGLCRVQGEFPAGPGEKGLLQKQPCYGLSGVSSFCDSWLQEKSFYCRRTSSATISWAVKNTLTKLKSGFLAPLSPAIWVDGMEDWYTDQSITDRVRTVMGKPGEKWEAVHTTTAQALLPVSTEDSLGCPEGVSLHQERPPPAPVDVCCPGLSPCPQPWVVTITYPMGNWDLPKLKCLVVGSPRAKLPVLSPCGLHTDDDDGVGRIRVSPKDPGPARPIVVAQMV
ncbi:hypothetical protein MG293_003928 [Ovis ammon polii]|uniref:Uncharacterized protein n=1 Tax=Ovis ammon polii TaxID=230172 RepID=A0AAD4UJE6_OVIAM|nr:hypothetical protein MG293_003928 [Ovis ammon polii]